MIFAVFRFMMIHIALTHCYKLESFFTLINQRGELENEYGIPYLYNIWAQAYINLRKIYINLGNHLE